MIDNHEFEIRVYYVLYGLDRAINIKEIRQTLYDAYDDFDTMPPEPKIRNLIRSWCLRGWCHKIHIAERQGYFYILSGKGAEYILGVDH